MIFQSGGMPSSHSAVVVGITTIIGMMDTIYSVEFGLAITIAAIVMYDARGVRREAGKHAQKLNQLTQTLSATHPTITPTHYNTHVGHSIPQIIG